MFPSNRETEALEEIARELGRLRRLTAHVLHHLLEGGLTPEEVEALRAESRRLAAQLQRSKTELETAIEANEPDAKEAPMPNPILGVLTEQIAQTRTVIGSAVTLIEGIQARIAAAIEAALANGATAAELAPFTDLEAALESDTTSLANAVAANTPTP